MPEVWYWAPNNIVEDLTFSTEILEARTIERRTSYMDAVQVLRYGYVASPTLTEKMMGLYLPDVTATFLVPEWPTATFSASAGASATDTVIDVVDDVVYEVGQQVILGRGDTWEQGEVASKGGTSITLTSGIGATYGASSGQPFFVAPLVESIITRDIEYSTVIPQRMLQVEFMSVAPVDLAANPYATFDGLPLVDDGDVKFGDLGGRAGQRTVLYRSGFGSFQVIPDETYTRRAGTLEFFDYTYAARMARRRFFHFMRGRDGEMWVPSYQKDLILNSGFSTGALTINVQPVTSAAEMVGKVIYIQQGSTTRTRTITGATDSSPTSQTLQFSGALGFTGQASAVVSLARKVRFDQDVNTLEYKFSSDGLMAFSTNQILEVA